MNRTQFRAIFVAARTAFGERSYCHSIGSGLSIRHEDAEGWATTCRRLGSWACRRLGPQDYWVDVARCEGQLVTLKPSIDMRRKRVQSFRALRLGARFRPAWGLHPGA